MEELDLLKKDWQEKDTFIQVSEGDIYKMLHKKSSSIVKWILIVSILEFVILNGISYFINDKSYDTLMKNYPFLSYLDYINYAVIIGFILLFYKNYKSISVSESSKILISQILKTRKIVSYYIFWNIFIGSFSGAFVMLDGFYDTFDSVHNIKINSVGQFIAILFGIIFIILFIWLFYKLLYGSLLNKLHKNYEELKKIDL